MTKVTEGLCLYKNSELRELSVPASKTTPAIEVKLHVEHPWACLTIVCSRYLRHMTKMAHI